MPGVPLISDTQASGHPRDVKENMIHQIRPPSSIALCSSSAHMPIVLFSVVDMDQRGHPDWFAAMHCHTQQTVMLREF